MTGVPLLASRPRQRKPGWQPGTMFTLVGLPFLAAPLASQAVPAQLTLEEAIRIAELQSPVFQQQWNALERSEIALRRDFRNTFLPNLSGGLGLSASTYREYTALNFDGVPLDDPFFSRGRRSNASQSVNMSMTVFSGQSFMNYRASRANAEATDISVETQLEAQRLALGGLFFRVIQADQRVELERRGLERAREDLDAAGRRFEFGQVDREQVLVAERALIRREQALELEIGNARKLRLDLLQQMGIEEEVPFDPVGDLPEPFDPASLDVQALVDHALESSPRIRQRSAQLLATMAGAQATRASRWPTVSVSASYRRTHASRDYQSFLELNPRNWGYSVGLQLSLPVPYLSYSQNANLALSAINLEEARDDYRWEHTVIENDVRKAVIDLTSAYRAIEVQQREVELSQELLFILEERNRAGQPIEYDRLESARDAATNAERADFNTRIAFQNQVLALEQLVGREIRP